LPDGCTLDIDFGMPAADFFGLCFFDLLFEVADDLGEGEGLGSAAWITALQPNRTTNITINFFMRRVPARLIKSRRKGNTYMFLEGIFVYRIETQKARRLQFTRLLPRSDD
jgi:hypothetical protein